jgi:bacterioferritin-associated ferredoxin
MIVCSCHVVTDEDVRGALATRPERMSQVYEVLGHVPRCGRCTHTVRDIMREYGQEFGGGGSPCCRG